MRMRAIAALTCFALGAASLPAFAGPDGAVDLFACIGDIPSTSPSATDFARCSGRTRSQSGGTIRDIAVHVYARLSGGTDSGVTGAELYIQGWEAIRDAGWTIRETVDPAVNVVVGSMAVPSGMQLDVRRINLAFTTCQPNPLVSGDFVFLGAVSAQGVGVPDIAPDTYLTVVPSIPPSNPRFSCASLVICEGPFPVFCVTGGQFIINPSGRDCTVAVTSSTWSELKALYRD